MDADPGWNTVSIALDGVVDANQSQDGQFHMTGWVPGPGDGEFDKDAPVLIFNFLPVNLLNVSRLIGMATGTTFQELSGGVLKNLKFAFPKYSEQKKISYFLTTLDDKIDNLRFDIS